MQTDFTFDRQMSFAVAVLSLKEKQATVTNVTVTSSAVIRNQTRANATHRHCIYPLMRASTVKLDRFAGGFLNNLQNEASKLTQTGKIRGVNSARMPALPEKPAASAPLADRTKYCDALKDTILRHGADIQPQERMPLLKSIAEQIKYLPSDKSSLMKGAEGVAKLGSFAVDRALGTNGEVTKFVAQAAAMPQKRAFDFLMSEIHPRHRHDESYKVNLLCQKKIKVKTFAPTERMVAQRKALAPVWEEMLQHAECLKPERRHKLLDSFKDNFNDFGEQKPTAANRLPLPSVFSIARGVRRYGVSEKPGDVQASAPILSKKGDLVQSFGTSFKHLAIALPGLADPRHTDSLSSSQYEAMNLLKSLRDDMSAEQRKSVIEGLNEIHRPGVDNHLQIEISHLLSAFRDKAQPSAA
jgi:hypothetical protein